MEIDYEKLHHDSHNLAHSTIIEIQKAYSGNEVIQPNLSLIPSIIANYLSDLGKVQKKYFTKRKQQQAEITENIIEGLSEEGLSADELIEMLNDECNSNMLYGNCIKAISDTLCTEEASFDKVLHIKSLLRMLAYRQGQLSAGDSELSYDFR